MLSPAPQCLVSVGWLAHLILMHSPSPGAPTSFVSLNLFACLPLCLPTSLPAYFCACPPLCLPVGLADKARQGQTPSSAFRAYLTWQALNNRGTSSSLFSKGVEKYPGNLHVMLSSVSTAAYQ